jgi:hypothetical protein
LVTLHIQLHAVFLLNFLMAESAVNFPSLHDPAERVDLLPYPRAAFPEDNAPLDE